MTLPVGIRKYQGKRLNTSSDKPGRTVYTRYYDIGSGDDLGDISGLARGNFMPDETDKYVSGVSIENENRGTKDRPSLCKVVVINGYKLKDWA